MPALENYTFNVVFEDCIYFSFDKLSDGTLVGKSGFNYFLLKSLSSILGFKYRLVLAGLDKENNHLAILSRGEADFSAHPVKVLLQRLKLAHFSPNIRREIVTYFTRKNPIFQAKTAYFFADPLQRKLWIFLALFIAISIATIQLLASIKTNTTNKVKRVSIWNMASFVMGIHRIDFAAKHLIGLLIVPFVILMACTLKIYGTTLSSSVNSKDFGNTINTISGLREEILYRNLTVGTTPYAAKPIAYVFKLTRPKELDVIAKSLEQHGFEYPEMEGFLEILNSHFAMVASLNSALHYKPQMEYFWSKINVPKEHLFVTDTALPYSISFQHKDIFSSTLSRCLAAGIMDRISGIPSTYLEEKPQKTNAAVYIDMEDLDIVFTTLLYSYCLAGFIFTMEIMWFNVTFYKPRKRIKRVGINNKFFIQ